MKKTLALVLALALVFSSISVVFAEGTLGADAQICADLGMLKGETGTVDAAYVATAPTRLQAAVMFLRLKGLEAEALAFTGAANFADGNIAWAEGANLLAYLKANPQLGWVGDGTNFNPNGKITAKEYYKVLLETLGYKQTSAEVVGDFTWDNVVEFAATVGLSKVAAVTSFTVNDLAIATVEALKVNVKDTDKTLAATLVEAGKITAAAAEAAGLIGEAAPAAVTVAVDEATAAGNSVVDVIFEDDVDASAANVANFSIEGLAINSAAVIGSDSVRLETAAMTSGKIYKLTVGDKTVQFTGVAKVSGGPEIKDGGIKSEDVEEVVVAFNKNIDLATGTDVANYSIAGVTIVAAEIDPDYPDEVILTTEGLKNKTKYTVKVTNVKSVDGVVRKSTSDSFTVKYDLTAPKIDDLKPETNQRISIYFNEKITKDTAEDLANYSIKVDEKDGAALEVLEAKLITTGTYKNKKVELVTEPQVKREDYKLSVSGIADRRKVANVVTRPLTKDFKGVAEDKTAPKFSKIDVLSPTTILVEFTDDSKLDEDSALDLSNYELENLDIESIRTIKHEWKTFRALLTVEEMETGKNYKLTIEGVLDEFGNALKKDSKVAKGVSDSFASAKPVDSLVVMPNGGVVATGENTIEVVFTKEVDETTAENIANYSINKEVGAPTKAELKDDGVTVKLTVNDLINGRGYKLTIDGVEDLAGNSLYYVAKINTKVAANKWDKEAPELEDVVLLNKDVVALSFDEMVKPEATSKLVLAVQQPNGKYVDANNDLVETIVLDTFDVVDDDTAVEFSKTGVELKNGRYTVVQIVYGANVDGGIKDLIGNRLSVSDITLGDFEVDGTTDLYDDFAEVESYEQVNATTFEVTMTRNVKVAGTDSDFNVTVDPDDDMVLIFTKKSGIIKEVDYGFNFSTLVKDFHGKPAANADRDDAGNYTVTYLSGEYEDKDKPYVDEVVAVDRDTIRVFFSENIDTSTINDGLFELKNYDLDKKVNITSVLADDDNDNAVLITVSKSLELRYEYELTVKKSCIKDFANLPVDEETTWYFQGTNLAVFTEPLP